VSIGGLIVFRLLSYRSSRVQEGRELDQFEFSTTRYEPMARLIGDEDLLFLRAQPGYRPEIGKKFIRERRRIFRLYLEELAGDFHRLHARARAIVASLPAEHSPLVGILMRQQVRFWYEMAVIEMRLSLDLMGAGSVRVRGLVDAVAAMHAEISRAALAVS
jgi:hypothetical protein